jgi:transcriptional regulator with XRE-family HTH domain
MPPSKRGSQAVALDKAYRAELKAMRVAKNWSQTDLARASGYRQSFISNIEIGWQTPRITVLFDLLEALDTQPDVFMRAVLDRIEAISAGSPKSCSQVSIRDSR